VADVAVSAAGLADVNFVVAAEDVPDEQHHQ
jgi:hypothetical protein